MKFNLIIIYPIKNNTNIKSRILIKAEEICRAIGFRALTMDDLASQLGISKKTIYQFYEDKNALIDDVMTEIIKNSQEKCLFAASTAKNAVDEIFLTMDMVREDFQTLNPIIVYDLQKYFPATFIKFQSHKNTFIYKLIVNNLISGQVDGYYRKEIDPEIMAKFRLESILIGFNQAVFPANKYSLVHVTHMVLEHFLYGIVTPKGLKLIEQYKTT